MPQRLLHYDFSQSFMYFNSDFSTVCLRNNLGVMWLIYTEEKISKNMSGLVFNYWCASSICGTKVSEFLSFITLLRV